MSSVAERYSRSVSATSLKWDNNDQTALDVILAAGMHIRDRHGNVIPDSGLGVMLLRLRAEFDSIRTMPNSRHMIPRLKSAGSVRTRMLAMVLERGGVMGQDAVDLVAKLLDQWCDPSCPPCTGRGSIGAYGEPQRICPDCGGSKRRTLFWPIEQQRFADEMAAEMESKVDSAERRIRRLLKE